MPAYIPVWMPGDLSHAYTNAPGSIPELCPVDLTGNSYASKSRSLMDRLPVVEWSADPGRFNRAGYFFFL